MKSCPRCGRQYPDHESFCEIDGTALTGSGGAAPRVTSVIEDEQKLPAQVTECPVCGGKAQPGEIICNFCGTRLTPDAAASAAQPAPPAAVSEPNDDFSRTSGRSGPVEIGTPPEPDFDLEPTSGHRVFGLLGFSIAAIVALAAGAWFAIYLSGRHPAPPPPIAEASPTPAVVSGPIVALASTMPVQVSGDLAAALQRDRNTLRKHFNDHLPGLVDVYKRVLESDPSLSDGMVVRLHIGNDGRVTSGAVRVSTSPNPSLDAGVVEAMNTWDFGTSKGKGVDADYPIIFALHPSDVSNIESNLSKKLASLGPNEAAEYAMAPSMPSAGASPSISASPAALATPAYASAPAELPPAVRPPEATTRPAPRKRTRIASAPPPEHMRKPPLIDRVTSELRANRRLRRVQAYTNGGTVTIFGKVFDNNDKLLAERTVRHVDGVTNVVDNLGTDMQDWAQNQMLITQRLQSAGLTDVTVKVIGHDAYLNGQVKNDLDRQRAVTIAQAAAPVKVRENLIRVEPGSMFGF